MRQTSALYQKLLQDPGSRKEVRVIINGVTYGEDRIVSLATKANLFPSDTMGVGGAIAKEIDLSLVEPGAIPPMAEVVPAYRLVLGEVSSEWVQKGVFFIDTRSADALTGVLTIHGYDVMLKAEQVWEPDQSLVFPMTMERASAEIARLIGVSIDPRTVFQPSYLVDYPANAYTLRDVLRYIAAAYAGNWIITDTGQLRLVTFAELPPESSFLITGYGSAITFGGVRILV